MGPIAPWTRSLLEGIHTRLRSLSGVARRMPLTTEQEESMPMRFALKPTLSRIWHAPDNFRLMDPLPPLHRRGIIVATLVVAVGFLWPSQDSSNLPVTRNAQLAVDSQTPIQAHLVAPTNDADLVAPIDPEPVQEPDVQQTQAPPPSASNDKDQQWRTYHVASGQTMAQLFRDNNLPPADVYSMAKVEGSNKPLSTLQTGQMVQIRKNANGVVTGLTIDVGNNQQVLFMRQPDGSFLRIR